MGNLELERLFAQELAQFHLSQAQLHQLISHYQFLARWNHRINLTRVIEPRAACRKHYVESLLLAPHLRDARKVLDVGSGAGFPGFPLAVAMASCEFHLAESVIKKATFLREASRSVANVRVRFARAEELQEEYDCVVARGVAPQKVARLIPVLSTRALMLLSRKDCGPGWQILGRGGDGQTSVIGEFHVKHPPEGEKS